MDVNEIVFKVTEADERGIEARALGYGIFTQGDDLALEKEAVGLFAKDLERL